MLPGRVKVCTFDCVYCQYGWSRCFDVADVADALPSVEDVTVAVGRALRALETPPAWLTFSGNGEPTLHPLFPEMVDALSRFRDRVSPESGTAILSNTTRVSDACVRAALARLDARILKLDAGDEETLRAYNRPAPKVSHTAIIDGLANVEDVTIQSLFAAGPDGNDSVEHQEHWLSQVRALFPRAVQLYTLDRGVPARGLRKAATATLNGLADQLNQVGVAAEVFVRG